MELDEEMPTFVLVHVWRRMGRVVAYAAEEMASRPRGQQVLRQVDRLLNMVERLARSLSDAISLVLRSYVRNANEGRVNRLRFSAMRLRRAIPLMIVVLPVFITTILVLMLPVLPIVLPTMIAGSLASSFLDKVHDSVRDVLPTPANVAAFLCRWRRKLRSIRFKGMRRLREANQGYHNTDVTSVSFTNVQNRDSLFSKLFVWWPVTALALFGQVVGLGSLWSPVNVSSVRANRTLKNVRSSSSEDDGNDAETSLKRNHQDSEDEEFKQAVVLSTSQILEDLPDAECSSDAYYTTDEEDVLTSGGSAGVEPSKDSLKRTRTSKLAILVSDEPLPSDNEKEDPNYMPDANEEIDEDEEDGDDDIDDDDDDDDEDDDEDEDEDKNEDDKDDDDDNEEEAAMKNS